MEQDDWQGWIGLVSILVFAFMIRYYKEVLNFTSALENNFWVYLPLIVIWLVILITGFIILYFAVKIIGRLLIFTFQSVYYKIAHWNDEARFIQNEKIEIENLLFKVFIIDEQNLTKDTERLRNKMNICRYYRELTHFIPRLKKRLAKAAKLLERLQEKRVMEEIKEETEKAKREFEEAQRKREIDTEREKDRIERELEMYSNNVYIKKDLTKKQIEILKENDYKQVNEYCVFERKFITVLIKTELNHSKTHEFLVWSVKRLLKKTEGVYNIQGHLTKNADVTFNFKNKKFALEIELGSLLRKKKQCADKINYLDKYFKNRWMFIVSNKNLLPRYRKLGLATPRNQMYENMQKLLKNAHPPKAGGKSVLSNIKP